MPPTVRYPFRLSRPRASASFTSCASRSVSHCWPELPPWKACPVRDVVKRNTLRTGYLLLSRAPESPRSYAIYIPSLRTPHTAHFGPGTNRVSRSCVRSFVLSPPNRPSEAETTTMGEELTKARVACEFTRQFCRGKRAYQPIEAKAGHVNSIDRRGV